MVAGEFAKQSKVRGFKMVFHRVNFSDLMKVFVSVRNCVSTQPCSHGFFLFWHQKWQNCCDEACSHFE